MTARIAEPSHYFIVMDLSKIRGIICMQLNFDRRAMRQNKIDVKATVPYGNFDI